MEQAFKEASVNPEVKWHPFFLNRPGTGPTGTPINEYLANKYGAGMVARASKALESAGSELGIKFNNERLMCDTLKAHILTDYARKFNKESEMAKAIFKSYFEDAQNIDNVDALVKIAEQVGLDGEDVRKLLRSGDGEEEVYNEVKEYAQKYRVTGVPYFIVSKKNMKKKFVFSGAQDKEFWLEAIEQAQDIKD
jgi:predicted DsbA family dithiol-disulfide isomerase